MPCPGKHITNQEMTRQRQYEEEGMAMSPDKKIEVLVTHIKKITANLCEARKKERFTADANEQLKQQNLKLSRKVNTLARNLEVLKAAATMKINKGRGLIALSITNYALTIANRMARCICK